MLDGDRYEPRKSNINDKTINENLVTLTRTVYQQTAPFVVGVATLVDGQLRSGSGFFIAPKYLVTNAHVIGRPTNGGPESSKSPEYDVETIRQQAAITPQVEHWIKQLSSGDESSGDESSSGIIIPNLLGDRVFITVYNLDHKAVTGINRGDHDHKAESVTGDSRNNRLAMTGDSRNNRDVEDQWDHDVEDDMTDDSRSNHDVEDEDQRDHNSMIDHQCNDYIYEVQIVGVDPIADIAILYLDPALAWNRKLPSLDNRGFLKWSRIGSANYQRGRPAISIGNTFNNGQTVSFGVIRDNALINGCSVTESVVTDAAIGPGNSGGPLLDENGEVIGIATCIETGYEYNLAISQRFSEPIVTALITAHQKNRLSAKVTLAYSVNCIPVLYYRKAVLQLMVERYDQLTVVRLIKENPMITGLPSERCGVFVNASRNPKIKEEEIILSIDGITIAGASSIGTQLVTWSRLPADRVTIVYRTPQDCYQTLQTKSVSLFPFPPMEDFIPDNELPDLEDAPSTESHD